MRPVAIVFTVVIITALGRGLWLLPKPRATQVRIVDVYHEERWGLNDWTTVIETPEGRRTELAGQLGKTGEYITVTMLR